MRHSLFFTLLSLALFATPVAASHVEYEADDRPADYTVSLREVQRRADDGWHLVTCVPASYDPSTGYPHPIIRCFWTRTLDDE